MENPGCVNFNDGYVYKEKMPMSRYVYLAHVIAHEMAHMWFGNLVTMKWWEDLWLNESYAEFICYFCLEHIKIESIELHSIPTFFNTGKSWGYREDQMVTTHPIAGEVPNTETAENIFDGITYSKGSAVMK
jgi:aminopeptidase N